MSNQDLREQLAEIVERTLGYTNGWKIDDEIYTGHCLAVADEILTALQEPEQVEPFGEQGCHYCNGKLDAKHGIGQYECPRCIAQFPSEPADLRVTRGEATRIIREEVAKAQAEPAEPVGERVEGWGFHKTGNEFRVYVSMPERLIGWDGPAILIIREATP